MKTGAGLWSTLLSTGGLLGWKFCDRA